MEDPAVHTIVLSEERSIMIVVIPGPTRGNRRMPRIIDVHPADDRAETYGSRVKWVVEVAVVTIPKLPRNAWTALSTYLANQASPKSTQVAPHLARVSQRCEFGEYVRNKVKSRT